jgi:hypothetical protein
MSQYELISLYIDDGMHLDSIYIALVKFEFKALAWIEIDHATYISYRPRQPLLNYNTRLTQTHFGSTPVFGALLQTSFSEFVSVLLQFLLQVKNLVYHY